MGAGGHARVCLEALQDDSGHEVVGAVSSDGTGIDALGVVVLGTDVDLRVATQSVHAATGFVAIGDNGARADVTARWLALGMPLVVAVSRAASVSRTAVLDDGAAVLPGAVVNAATRIGRGAIVNTNASVDHDCDVGEFVHVAPGAAIGGGVTIGAGTLVGLGARVLPGLRIGAGAVIGGGAVVVRDVAPGAVVVGVPAREHVRDDHADRRRHDR
jgi:UDP-perosamine 4-acetyltransferase